MVPARGGESGDTDAVEPSPTRFVLAEDRSEWSGEEHFPTGNVVSQRFASVM